MQPQTQLPLTQDQLEQLPIYRTHQDEWPAAHIPRFTGEHRLPLPGEWYINSNKSFLLRYAKSTRPRGRRFIITPVRGQLEFLE